MRFIFLFMKSFVLRMWMNRLFFFFFSRSRQKRAADKFAFSFDLHNNSMKITLNLEFDTIFGCLLKEKRLPNHWIHIPSASYRDSFFSIPCAFARFINLSWPSFTMFYIFFRYVCTVHRRCANLKLNHNAFWAEACFFSEGDKINTFLSDCKR